jgi:hypothetical protein
MNRRKFIKGAGALGVLGGASIAGTKLLGGPTITEKPAVTETAQVPTPQEPRKIVTLLDLFQMENDWALTTEGATAICLYVDSLADAIEHLFPPPPRTLEQAKALVLEVAPFAVYERILPETYYDTENRMRRRSIEVLPDIELLRYGGDSSFHLLGTAECFDLEEPVFNLNIRYYNPYSSLYNREEGQVATIIHELMHMQGICTNSSRGDEYNRDVESATQIATIEVLAAMTRNKNRFGLLPFLRELEGYAADVILLDAINNDNINFYKETILKPIANDSYRLASFEKSMEHWYETYALKFRLREIVDDYGVKPYKYLVEALNSDDYMTRKLPFPNPQKVIAMNDAAYVMDHVVDLVRDYPAIL